MLLIIQNHVCRANRTIRAIVIQIARADSFRRGPFIHHSRSHFHVLSLLELRGYPRPAKSFALSLGPPNASTDSPESSSAQIRQRCPSPAGLAGGRGGVDPLLVQVEIDLAPVGSASFHEHLSSKLNGDKLANFARGDKIFCEVHAGLEEFTAHDAEQAFMSGVEHS
jgi:hypothetical protein